ncbi:DUF3800 domain-containing protein [Candidatus Amesbacteria bacterium]|nr:DUF3800 domain-containing protein [Candidatus Amesbacteria bacterium]
MIVFIDESGIDKTSGHTSVVFVYLQIRNAERFNSQVLEIEKKMGINYFHWADERWVNRKKFLNKISKLEFEFKSCKLINPSNISQKFETIIQSFVIEKHINHIIIDGKKPKWYSSRIKVNLRKRGVSVKKLRTGNDRSFPGLRVADGLAGLMRYYYDNPSMEETSILVKKILNEKLIYESSI